ncbi:MAG: glycoside hydrolase family 16 protein [Chloroflexi bacterium]|nr:MAG: glycoside hydrolase family 16 protein [Chloroflexota bacterium]
MNVGMRDIQLRLRKVRNVAPILIRTLMLLIASCLLTEGACFGGLLPCTGQVIQHPSGQVAPIGDIPGWHQIFVEDFNTDVAVGSFLGAAYKDKFTVYADGVKDTAGQKGAPSRYYPSKVVSVSGGLLNLYLHTENGTPMSAALLPILPGNNLYGKYTIRFRSDALAGFKTAWLLWPNSENWPHDGEIDFPEGSLDGTMSGFVHHQNAEVGTDQDINSTSVTYTAWHTASIEWSPNKVRFIVDDKLIGTSITQVPNTLMHWVIQTEACTPTCPDVTTAGNLQIDWVTAYSPA